MSDSVAVSTKKNRRKTKSTTDLQTDKRSGKSLALQLDNVLEAHEEDEVEEEEDVPPSGNTRLKKSGISKAKTKSECC